MRRRVFLQGLSAGMLGLVAARPVCGEGSARRLSVTIDDFALSPHPHLSVTARHAAILDALERHGIRAAGFVCGKRVDSDEGRLILGSWGQRGHLVANHTYSHPALSGADLARFQADVLNCEKVIADVPGFTKLFRFPYLDEGREAQPRDAMRAFLHEQGYRNGHVTIDASDWYVDRRLRERLDADPGADVSVYRDFYLEHMLARAAYYDGLARDVLGRSIPHTLLMHHNLLNGLFLGDLLDRFAFEGWALIDAQVAYEDPVFASEPDSLPAGQSLVWALAKATGRYDDRLRYPGENDTYEKPRMDELGL